MISQTAACITIYSRINARYVGARCCCSCQRRWRCGRDVFGNVTTRRSAPALRRLEGRGCWYRQSRLLRRVGWRGEGEVGESRQKEAGRRMAESLSRRRSRRSRTERCLRMSWAVRVGCWWPRTCWNTCWAVSPRRPCQLAAAGGSSRCCRCSGCWARRTSAAAWSAPSPSSQAHARDSSASPQGRGWSGIEVHRDRNPRCGKSGTGLSCTWDGGWRCGSRSCHGRTGTCRRTCMCRAPGTVGTSQSCTATTAVRHCCCRGSLGRLGSWPGLRTPG